MAKDPTQTIPPEVWLEIFTHTTPAIHDRIAVDDPPFRLPGATYTDLSTKESLSRVCRHWRDLTSQQLYEEVVLADGLSALLTTLMTSDSNFGFRGNLVKRVVLPFHSTCGAPWAIAPIIAILKACTQIKALVRPSDSDRLRYSSFFDYEVEAVAFPSLLRLEWHYNDDAERSGGINSLTSVLRGAPNVRYLSISGADYPGYILLDRSPTLLSHLEVLRISTSNPHIIRVMCNSWTMPSLSKIIFDVHPQPHSLDIIFEHFGPQLRAVEFGRRPPINVEECLLLCLGRCPNLLELNCHTLWVAPLETFGNLQNHLPHPNITTIKLHNATPLLDAGETHLDLDHHSTFLASDALPSLKRVVLCGDWRVYTQTSHFKSVVEKLLRSGRTLEVCVDV
ncbi:hypothetical protein DFP72DRAFT_899985 [Ephemerocybe angulata]|uniref:F-box domain-containing protein n=1 Tax=Ephemerocybe angulata TaxID=980116 RepID=A0A8H6HW49_9AGAR|nr:hypothetical protein DFP72DRAFT_899985 [Tulosesus angulatus]